MANNPNFTAAGYWIRSGRVGEPAVRLRPTRPVCHPGDAMKRQLYLDCDGVLADFDRGATAVLGLDPQTFQKRHGQGRFWQKLASAPDFYFSLPLMPDAMELFDAVRNLNPVILTGLPRGNWAAEQKVRWAAEHFPGIRII